jgi:hypothetical protein
MDPLHDKYNMDGHDGYQWENEVLYGRPAADQPLASITRNDRDSLAEFRGGHCGVQQHGFRHSTPRKDRGQVEDLNARAPSSIMSPIVHFDHTEKEMFELMNIRIVVYSLNGVMCEKEPVKKKRFGRKDGAMYGTPVGSSGKGGTMGLSTSSISSGDVFSLTETDYLESQSIPTTAVVSCQKNAISSKTAIETFLPSLPLQRPVATFVNKVRYVASWTSERSFLQKDFGAIDLSSFKIIRCMKLAAFTPGVGVGSNYVHETIELGINLTRGTEMIPLGTASLIVGGDEEGEVHMNVPAKPITFKNKKFLKKKNKYGFFFNDPLRRYYLDENASIKVGVQVIPEATLRFAKEKERKKVKKDDEVRQILDDDDLKFLLRKMGNENLNRAEKIQFKNLPLDECKRSPLFQHKETQNKQRKSHFPDFLCGAMTIPTFCVSTPFARTQNDPEVPTVIHAGTDLDNLAITSLISSVSESTDGSEAEGKSSSIFSCRLVAFKLMFNSQCPTL